MFRIFQRDRPSGMWELLTSMLRKTKDFPFTGREGLKINKPQTPQKLTDAVPEERKSLSGIQLAEM